jgi:hypothetical protein
MRVFLGTLIASAIVLLAYGQQADFEKDDFRRNHVKRETTVSQDIPSLVTTTYIDDFDRHGNRLKRAAVASDGKTLIEWSYRYDDHNELIESSSSRTILSGATKKTVSRTYSERGVTAAVIYNEDGSVYERQTFRRNTAGKPLEASAFNAAGKATGGQRYVYDDRGNLIEFTKLGAGGEVISRSTHTFNRKGNATRTVDFDASGHVSTTTEFDYDDTGEYLNEEREYDGSGKLHWRVRHKRNADGFVVETNKTDSSGHLVEVKRTSWELYK